MRRSPIAKQRTTGIDAESARQADPLPTLITKTATGNEESLSLLTKEQFTDELLAAKDLLEKNTADFNVNDVISSWFNLKLSNDSQINYQREIKSPFGDYKVIGAFYDYEALKNNTVIDIENIRDACEHTKEALLDLYYEIESGYQIQPIIGYLKEDGKFHLY